jgi:hypothetical protein
MLKILSSIMGSIIFGQTVVGIKRKRQLSRLPKIRETKRNTRPRETSRWSRLYAATSEFLYQTLLSAELNVLDSFLALSRRTKPVAGNGRDNFAGLKNNGDETEHSIVPEKFEFLHMRRMKLKLSWGTESQLA